MIIFSTKNISIEKQLYIRSRLEKINNFENIEASLEGKKLNFTIIMSFFSKKFLEKCEEKTNSNYITSNLEISYKNNCRYLLADKQIDLDENIFLTKKNYNEFFYNFFEIYGIKKKK